jgi:Protein of unknown function (DUF2439)
MSTFKVLYTKDLLRKKNKRYKDGFFVLNGKKALLKDEDGTVLATEQLPNSFSTPSSTDECVISWLRPSLGTPCLLGPACRALIVNLDVLSAGLTIFEGYLVLIDEACASEAPGSSGDLCSSSPHPPSASSTESKR